MAAAAALYVAWIDSTAVEAEQTASQAMAAAAAYQSAFAMTVSPATVSANRAHLASLVATNTFGQNTPAIAATETQYGEMWAQDAAAMYGYAANSAAASQVTPFTEAPQTTNLAGSAAQSAAVTQATGTAAGNAQASLSGLISQTLQSLATPAASTPSSSGLLGNLLGNLSLTSSATGSATGGLSGLGSSLLGDYLYLPAFFGAFLAIDALSPLMSNAETAAPAAAVGDATGGGPTGAQAARMAPRAARPGQGVPPIGPVALTGARVRCSPATPGSRLAWARRLRWAGCRCRRIGFGRRRLRRRCCFPRVRRCQGPTPNTAADWVFRSCSAGYQEPQLPAPQPAPLVPNSGHASRSSRALHRLDTRPNRRLHPLRDIRSPRRRIR